MPFSFTFKAALFLLFFLLFSNSFARGFSGRILLTAEMNAQNVVPSVSSPALGVGSFLLNESRDSMQVNINVTGLSSKVLGVYIHSGLPKTNGQVILDLTPNLEGNIIRMIITGNLLSDNLNKFISGELYLNFHTFTNAGGEVRGQIEIECDYAYAASLIGAAVFPPDTSMGQGLAILKLNRKKDSLEVFISTNDPGGSIDSAHLHSGIPGSNGAIAIDLSPLIKGGTLRGIVSFPLSLLTDLDSGHTYIDIHSGLYPAGSIRGQLQKISGLAFDAKFSNDQVTSMPTVSNGFGTGSLRLSHNLDTLYYDILVDSLSDIDTAVHFHLGAAGQNGPVVFDPGTAFGNRLIGNWNKNTVGTPLTPSLVTALLSGMLYADFHTKGNTSGELRAQIMPQLREGFVFDLDGKQQVPESSTSAAGGGIASIDRGLTNLHYMLAISGLSSDVSGVHFHKQLKGQNGPTVFDITASFLNNGAFGYWDASSLPAFDSIYAQPFFYDSMYVDLHTNNNPNGEVRGQLTGNYRLSFFTSYTAANSPGNFKIYPNPFLNLLNVVLQNNSPAFISISDMCGRSVFEMKIDGKDAVNEIDPGYLNKGLYLLSIKQNNNTFVQKIARY